MVIGELETVPLSHTGVSTMPGIKGLTRRERFLLYLPSRVPDTCWVWHGAIRVSGLRYGKFKDSDARSKPAHRIAFEIFNDCTLTEDQKVLHTCDNPPCCNPAHLYIGTDLDNARDREERERSNPHKGEEHHKTTLTTQEILEIRSNPLPQREIADAYGISQQAVSKIKLRLRWQHVA